MVNLLVPLLGVTVLLSVGLPIGFSLGLFGFIGLVMVAGWKSALATLGPHSYATLANFLFSPIPLFIIMGEVIAVSGVGEDLYTAALKWFGRLRGGLGVASVIACAIFAAMCGLSMAGTLAIGVVAIPAMLKHGYDRALATGSVTVAGTLGVLIPPSLPFIMYGVIAEQSIGQLFMAGILPGLAMTTLYSGYILLVAWRRPHLAPGISGITWKERLSSLKRLWALIVLIMAVLGSIYLGVATPTEAAGVGAFGALIIAFIYRRMDAKGMWHVAWRTVELCGSTLFLVVGAMLFTRYLTITGATQAVGSWITSWQVPGLVTMIPIIVVLLILGCFLDATAIILITTPIFLPTLVALGFSPIWYGVILIITIEIAFVTPPVGMNLYVIQRIVPDVPLSNVLSGSVPFLGLTLLNIALVMFFPQLALWLPSMMIR